MIAAWIVVSLAIALPIAGAAWCADALASRHGHARRLPWAIALAALALLTALAPLRRVERAPSVVLPTVTTTSGAAPASPRATAPRTLRDVATALRTTIAAPAARAATLAPAVQRTLGVAWLAATVAMLATLALAWHRMARARRTWPRAEVDGVAVRVAREGTPAVVGLGRAMEIVVPAWVLALPPARRALVLAHEREHVTARDPWLLVLAAASVALLPWHPVAWWLAARLATAIETDCDARVLAAGADVRTYGALLLDVAAGRCAPSLLAPWPALGGRRSTLELRIRAMTDRRRTPRTLASFATGTVVAGALLVACDSGRLPTSAEVERMDARAVQARVLDVLPLEATGPQGKVTWFVDDKPASEAEAKAIAPERIASIDVRRQVGRDTASVIRIVTRAAGTGARGYVMDRTTVTTRDTTARSLDVVIRDSAGVLAGTIDTTKRVVIMRRMPGDSAPRLLVATPAGSGATPVYYIDGVKADADAMKRLAPDRIVSVEVLKGEAARMQYGAEGVNGVIRITTKK